MGTSGNAAGKPPHLHYSIVTLVPYVFRIDAAPQGWMKMFYLNPIDYLESNCLQNVAGQDALKLEKAFTYPDLN